MTPSPRTRATACCRGRSSCLNTVEPDLIRNVPAMPDVPGPDGSTPNGVDDGVPRRRCPGGRRARRGRRRRLARDVLLAAQLGVVRVGGGEPGRAGVVPAGLHHRSGDAPAPRHRQHRRLAQVDLHRRDLAHRALPRALRRRGVAPRRAGGELRRSWPYLRDGLGVHPGRHAGVDVRAGRNGARSGRSTRPRARCSHHPAPTRCAVGADPPPCAGFPVGRRPNRVPVPTPRRRRARRAGGDAPGRGDRSVGRW